MTDRVFVTRNVPGEALSRLSATAEVDVWPERMPPSADDLAAHARDADALLTMLTDHVDEALLEAAPRVRVVANMATGYDNIDVAELTRRQIPVGNTPGVLTEATADLTWALILAGRRRLVEAAESIPAGEWRSWEPDFMLGQDVAGATLGIVGFGRIGAAVARRAMGFSMQLLASSRTSKDGSGVRFVDLPSLLERSDIVTLHCALTPESRHLIDAAALARMRPTALLVNTARGAIVDQRALVDALRAGRIGGAALDVVEEEPIPLDDPLLTLPNCTVLPHIGSATASTRGRMADLAVDNLLAGLAGQPLPNCINPEVYDRRDFVPLDAEAPSR